MSEFTDEVIAEFARSAPRHHHVVFKAHPLEDGRGGIRQAGADIAPEARLVPGAAPHHDPDLAGPRQIRTGDGARCIDDGGQDIAMRRRRPRQHDPPQGGDGVGCRTGGMDGGQPLLATGEHKGR